MEKVYRADGPRTIIQHMLGGGGGKQPVLNVPYQRCMLLVVLGIGPWVQWKSIASQGTAQGPLWLPAKMREFQRPLEVKQFQRCSSESNHRTLGSQFPK